MVYYITFNIGSTSIKSALFNNMTKLKTDSDIIINLDQKIHKILNSYFLLISDVNTKIIILHRVVHPFGFNKSVVNVNSNNIKKMKKYQFLAELHNTSQIRVIELVDKFLKDNNSKQHKINVENKIIFDNCFFNNIPYEFSHYALPLSYHKKGFRKYGFHGLAHFSSNSKLKKMNSNYKNMILCHLGGGCSITAIKNNKAITNSMEFSPLSGLVSMTRCNIDDVMFYALGKYTNKTNHQLVQFLDEDCGVKALASLRNEHDNNKIHAFFRSNKKEVDIFVNEIVKYFAYYFALLDGKVDCIAFSGNMSKHNPPLLKKIIAKLGLFGLKLEKKVDLNDIDNLMKISNTKSKTPIYFVEVDEFNAMIEFYLKNNN